MKLADLEKLLKDAAAERSDAPVRKLFDVQVVKAEGQPLRIAISTASVDRDQDTIAIGGWKLDTYRPNPVVLWMHDRWGPPVARSSREWIETDKLWSEPEFTPKDLYPFGHMIGEMLKAGFLNTASVGFKPLKYVFNEERGGVDFLEQELREYSIVTIPANPEALVARSKSAGIDLAPAVEWAERFLDREKGVGVWMPRAEAERLWKAAKPATVVVPPPAAVTPAPAPAKATKAEIAAVVDDALKNAFDKLRTAMTGRLPD